MNKIAKNLIWIAVAVLGAWAYVVLAVRRGEPLNSAYILIAALCSYALGFRFYSKWIAARVLMLNDRRATPCEVHDDGRDFVKTNKWIVFGHHFAAISGPGPLVGPVLAAQFGYLPGTLWILIGVVLGGAVQDFVILFASMRRDGKSLAQMVREELNKAAGIIGVIAILSIMIILLAVLALVVVNALAESPWGVFTVGATIPIALFMGGYLRFWRTGKVMEASVIGVVLLLLAVAGGQWISENATLKEIFGLKAPALAWSVIIYAFAASVLPVWLLLAPRDYLSTFMKLGTIFLLALGVLLVLPELKMPALTKFVDGSGPVVPGKLFPFCFITIACGAISGFHTLISSGITPKIITRESYARPIGYGAMCLESLVAIMAMIAACTLEPGVYLAMNIKAPGADAAAVAEATVTKVNSFGPEFALSTARMSDLARDVKEESLYGRTGGAATLAVGMANLFSKVVGEKWLGIWYHFALMFEALFILTTLDAGTRVGRYLLQDALGHVWKPMGEVRSLPANIAASGLVVGAWGYFLMVAVYDPDGGIKALWPIFGIANQLLAATALCLATTVILKVTLTAKRDAPSARAGLETGGPSRSPGLALVTLVPLLWLLAVTGTAAVQKVFHEETKIGHPRLGFLQIARETAEKVPALQKAANDAAAKLPSGADSKREIKAPKTAEDLAIVAAQNALKTVRSAKAQVINNRLDAAVTAFFLLLVAGIFLISLREWILLLARKRLATLHEAEPVWLPDYAIAEGKPLRLFSLLALAFALAKELSGEAALDRAQQTANICACGLPAHPKINLLGPESSSSAPTREQLYVQTVERRFEGVNRCC
ncbi:MAG TPA: carbon starvation CstA family protein [Verrucomicrobiae bacterium]|nr:carbon starvation CstA family protein [Verrucomicrobiae bacterium]